LIAIAALAVLLLRADGCGQAGDGARPLPEPGANGRIAANVTRVVDGDTIEAELAGGGKEDVRLIGIDTPETVDPDQPVQCFGPEASAFTHRLLDGARVELAYGAERRDRYGRLLAYVYLPGGRLFNAILARRGLARPLTIAPNDARAPLFERLAAGAASAGRGLWGACPS
jgi:micrococcal nuclease